MDKLKKKIKTAILRSDEDSLEEVRKMYNEWMSLLDELLVVPGHQVSGCQNLGASGFQQRIQVKCSRGSAALNQCLQFNFFRNVHILLKFFFFEFYSLGH